jgi:hypothetical protein
MRDTPIITTISLVQNLGPALHETCAMQVLSYPKILTILQTKFEWEGLRMIPIFIDIDIERER